MIQKAVFSFGYMLVFILALCAAGSADEIEALRLKAQQGDPEAQLRLGQRYYGARPGVNRDLILALKWIQKAAEQGYARAQYCLGWHYMVGQGVQQDDRQSCHWYRLAAEQGESRAQTNLALCYEMGIGGLIRDYAEAFKWYELAAEQGNAIAGGRLIRFYEEGLGVPQNFSKVAELLRKDAEKGYSHSQYKLGVMYAQGRGVSQDLIKAHMWLNLAASNVPDWIEYLRPEMVEWREKVAGQLTPDKLNEAQSLASDFKPSGK